MGFLVRGNLFFFLCCVRVVFLFWVGNFSALIHYLTRFSSRCAFMLLRKEGGREGEKKKENFNRRDDKNRKSARSVFIAAFLRRVKAN